MTTSKTPKKRKGENKKNNNDAREREGAMDVEFVSSFFSFVFSCDASASPFFFAFAERLVFKNLIDFSLALCFLFLFFSDVRGRL